MYEARNDVPQDELPWWLHPVPIFIGLNGLTGIAAFLTNPGTYLELWGTPKYFNGFTLLLTAAVIVVFSAGAWLALSTQSGRSSRAEWRGTVSYSQALLLFNISFWVCIMAYAIWIGLGISRGFGVALLRSIFFGANVSVYTLRESLQTVPGITTWTQVGIAAVILGCMIGAGRGWKIVRRKLAILAVLGLIRALFYSERLAFLELAIPFLVSWLAEPGPWKRSRALRTLVRFAPLMGAVFIYIVFTGFETLRSWTIFYSARESSLLQFGFWRLVGYYITSVNNTAYLLSSLHHPMGAPYFSFSFLWEFPVLNVFVRDLVSWVHMDYKSYMDLLELGANPEFNNSGGLLAPVVDFGVLGGLGCWAVMGLVTGYLYNLYIRKHPLGMCLYPIVFLTLTEIPRYLYWGEGRAFPALVYLILSAIVLLRSARFSNDPPKVSRSPIGDSIAMPARV